MREDACRFVLHKGRIYGRRRACSEVHQEYFHRIAEDTGHLRYCMYLCDGVMDL